MYFRFPLFHLKKHNGLTYCFVIVLFAVENFGYLIPVSEKLIGPFKFSDIGFFLATIWIFAIVIKVRFNVRKLGLPLIPVLYFFVWFFSATVNKSLYGQSYLDSFIRSRRLLLAILLLYAIVIALQKGFIVIEDVLKIVMLVAIFELVIDYTQFLLSDVIQFTYYNIQERYNSARLRAPYLLVLIAGYYSFDNYLNSKYKKASLIMAIMSFFLLIGICKHRAPSIILLGTILIAYLLWKKKATNKVIIGIVILLVVLPTILNSTLIRDSLRTAVSTDANVNTLIIRDRSRAYYLEELTKSWAFGFGESYNNNLMGKMNEGERYGFIRDDTGIWGFLYSHGIVGAIWVFAFFFSYLKKAYRLYSSNKRYVYVLYLIFEVANLYMGMHWYYDYQYPLFITCGLLDYEFLCHKKSSTSREDIRIWSYDETANE